MRRHAVPFAALVVVALAFPVSRAQAQGFGVYEHDACTMARGGTGVAAPCNASAIFFNPAGLLNGDGHRWHIAVGGTLINAKFAFQDSITGQTTNSTGGGVPVPNAYVTYQMNDRVAFGLGLFAPYGLVSEWPETFSGRFLGYRSELKSIYLQPTVSMRVNRWLQIGAGVDYVRSSVNLKQRVDLSSQATPTPGVTFANLGIPLGTDFANAELSGNSWSATGHFGVIVSPSRRLSFGARYLLRNTADIHGDASFTQVPTGIILAAGNPICNPPGQPPQCPANTPLDAVLAPQFQAGGALTTQNAATDVRLPDQLVLGIAIRPIEGLTVLGDYQFVNWSRFSKLVIGFENLGVRTLYEDYKNTSGWRIGAEYVVTPAITVRGGLLTHDGAAPDQTVTPLLPEGARAEQTIGIGLRLTANARLDLAYQHINQQDRRGRITDAPRGTAGLAYNTGLYTGHANLFGASLAWGF